MLQHWWLVPDQWSRLYLCDAWEIRWKAVLTNLKYAHLMMNKMGMPESRFHRMNHQDLRDKLYSCGRAPNSQVKITNYCDAKRIRIELNGLYFAWLGFAFLNFFAFFRNFENIFESLRINVIFFALCFGS